MNSFHEQNNLSSFNIARQLQLVHLTFISLFSSFSADKFKKIDEEFTKCNTFLISCLDNIVKRGAFPHCEWSSLIL